MSLGMLTQSLLGALILLSNDARDLLVNHAGTLVTVWFGETIVLTCRVIIADVWQFLTHTVIYDHGVSLLGDTFKVIRRSGRNVAKE